LRFLYSLCCAALLTPALATNSGIDTPTGVPSLPFAIEGMQIMDLTTTGLAIGRRQDGGWQLEVQGSGNRHGIFGQAGASGYWGVGGYSTNGNEYGCLGVANGLQRLWCREFIERLGRGIHRQHHRCGRRPSYGGGNNWAGLFYGNTSGNSQYGIAAQGTSWAGYFMGPVVITSGYLQFPDGSQQITAAGRSTLVTSSGQPYGNSTGFPNPACPAGSSLTSVILVSSYAWWTKVALCQ
jgi:hypothetical protein